MTRDDYYNMAVASGLWQSKPIKDTALMAINLMRFVEMVAAVEREACAKACEDLVRGLAAPYDSTIVDVGQGCADFIRFRGQKP
jgi:hypothetical protein